MPKDEAYVRRVEIWELIEIICRTFSLVILSIFTNSVLEPFQGIKIMFTMCRQPLWQL